MSIDGNGSFRKIISKKTCFIKWGMNYLPFNNDDFWFLSSPSPIIARPIHSKIFNSFVLISLWSSASLCSDDHFIETLLVLICTMNCDYDDEDWNGQHDWSFLPGNDDMRRQYSISLSSAAFPITWYRHDYCKYCTTIWLSEIMMQINVC